MGLPLRLAAVSVASVVFATAYANAGPGVSTLGEQFGRATGSDREATIVEGPKKPLFDPNSTAVARGVPAESIVAAEAVAAGPQAPRVSLSAPVAAEAALGEPVKVDDQTDPHSEPETLVATVKSEVSVLTTFDEPDGEPVEFEYELTNPTYFDNDLVLMVTDQSPDERWLKVQVPVRPNGTEAWIRSADVTLDTHSYRARVDLSDRSVTVWDGAEVVASTEAVVGAELSPTPLGSFYVNELVTKWDGSAYGPYILSLSGFSEALETFNGGIPVIAIHGTNRPELIGGAHSNGCIRIPNDVVGVLAETVPMGTPVDIVA